MKRFLFIIIFIGAWFIGYSQSQIDSIEVFFDNDPGVGNGYMFVPSSPDTAISEAISAATDTLSMGTHIMGVRVKSSYNATAVDTLIYPGSMKVRPPNDSTISTNIDTTWAILDPVVKRWSVTEYKSFYVGSTQSATTEQVDTVEYFFDSDPGVGNGVIISVSAADSINLSQNLASDTLSPGFHTLGIRVKGNFGNWSVTEYRSVNVNTTGTVTIDSINTMEYFFDSDPGYGNGINIPISQSDSVTISQNLASDTLNAGFHTLGVRTMDINGNWSVTDYKSFYIGSSGAASVTPIDSVDYYFDTDPGFGNGIQLSVTPSDSVTISQNLASDTLSTGFHVLIVRARDQDGNWSLPEYRSVVVSSSSQLTVSPLTTIEYFYDNDPGFGNGTQIPASGDSFQVQVNTPAFATPGVHTLTVRAQNADGIWSIGEVKTVYSLNPSRELDSLALIEVYNATGGASWTNRTNWLSPSATIDNWYGVTLAGGRVDSLNLSSNNMIGKLPKEFAYITSLRSFVLSGNAITDSIPYQLPSLMTGLQYIDVSNNSLNGLPDLSSEASLTTLIVTQNYFDFGDLEPNAGVVNINYTNQGPVTTPFDSVVNINQLMSIGLTMGGTNNYQWYKDSTAISGANTNTYIIPSVTPGDSGKYYCLIDNASLPGLTLTTAYYQLRFASFTNDSLALVTLYDSTNGSGWTVNTNWLTGNVSTWAGVTVSNGGVRTLNLPFNNLTGRIQDNISYLDSLTHMDLSGNNISGKLPASVNTMDNLQFLDLSSNAVDSIPALNLAPNLDTVNVSGNKLHFDDLEVNLSLAQFTYAPQDSAGNGGFVLVDAGNTQIFNAGVRGSNNLYQWYKDGSALTGQTTGNLQLNNVSFADEGFYNVRVTNSIVTGLTIFTKVIELGVSSLQRDSVALVTLYQTTSGDSWTDKTGWDASNRGTIDTWVGVKINNNRITAVNLPDNNLDGTISDKIRDITQLDTLDVSGNKITAIPFLGTMTNLARLDVSNNQLGFEYLEPNVSVPGFVYNPQDSLEGNPYDTIPVGTDLTLHAISRSANNSYSWSLNGNTLPGATDSVYTITSIQRPSMGYYSAAISNSVITDLQEYTKPARILADASVAGKVIDSTGTPVTAGTMRMFRITPSGGFDTTNVVSIGSGGSYTIPSVVLDDYILGAEPDSAQFPDLIPSYFGNTIYWEEADTIPLTNDTSLIDLIAISKPALPNGNGSIFGVVESDLSNGRILRRVVKDATVSITLTEGGQRNTLRFYRYRINGTEQLIEVTKTDAQGRFTLPSLNPGTYRINIQYPGVPMDQSTNVILTVGSTTDSQDVQVGALVTDTGIEVQLIDNTTGLEDALSRNYKIYPVPASDVLMIESKDGNASSSGRLSIVDMNGQEMFDSPVNLGRKNEIDVHNFRPGVYILRIIPDSSLQPVEVARIIISR